MHNTVPSDGMSAAALPQTFAKRHILTVGLDDYYHAEALKGSVHRSQWYRFESRLEQNALLALELLERSHTKATFFVMGWAAERCPELVKEVARQGHEIASQGYCHRGVREMTAAEFADDLARSRDVLEGITGTQMLGNRCARPLISPSDLWALDVVASQAYLYDSSLLPVFRSFAAQPWRRFAHRHRSGDRELWEFPFSTWNCLGALLPIAGGIYFRQLPHRLMKPRVDEWHRNQAAPFVMYFHVSELDRDQPRIYTATLLARIRHYRNLGKLRWVLPDYLQSYRFTSVADYLGVAPEILSKKTAPTVRVPEIGAVPPADRIPVAAMKAAPQLPVTIVVPFFNEEEVLSYFANTIASVEADLGAQYDLSFIFVDDGSTDKTLERLHATFAAQTNCTVLSHGRNRGVSAAIATGLRHAKTEIVCSMDCDCTYDPHELRNFIPALAWDVDMVTASPYHPQGAVLNVPAWRLSLSKSASFLYRCVLHNKLFTYTSCFRVYRRSAVVGLPLTESGFLGVAEMLGRLDLQGSTIREYPATLQVRLFGRSKMKVVRTIVGHLKVLGRLLQMRLTLPPVAANCSGNQSCREPARPDQRKFPEQQLPGDEKAERQETSAV